MSSAKRAGSSTGATTSTSWPGRRRSRRSLTCSGSATCRRKAELAGFQSKLEAEPRAARPAVIDVLRLLPDDAAPMDALRTGVSALGAIDSEHFDETPDLDEAIAICGAVPGHPGGVLPPAAAASSRSSRRRDTTRPRAISTSSSAKSRKSGTGSRSIPISSLLADHGMNASTFTARVIASTQSDLMLGARPARSARSRGPSTVARRRRCSTCWTRSATPTTSRSG